MMRKTLLIMVAMLLSSIATFAANYQISAVRGKSTTVFEKAVNDDGEAFLGKAVQLENGTVVTVKNAELVYFQIKKYFLDAFLDRGIPFVEATADGQAYFVEPYDLTFGEDNPSSAENPLYKYTQRTKYQTVFLGILPYILLVVLMALVCFCMVRAKAVAQTKAAFPLLALANILLLGVVAIEIAGLLLVKGEFFWWIYTSRCGLVSSFIYAIPLAFVLTVQFFSLRLYKWILLARYKGSSAVNGLAVNVDDMAAVFSLKPFIISLLISVGILLAALFITGTRKMSTEAQSIGLVIGLGLAIIGFIIGVAKVIKNAKNKVGLLHGILFSFFVPIWLVGFVTMMVILVWGLFKALIPVVLVTTAVAFIFMRLVFHDDFTVQQEDYSDLHSKPKQKETKKKYRSAYGQEFDDAAAADNANRVAQRQGTTGFHGEHGY